jgi:hypothetical protein
MNLIFARRVARGKPLILYSVGTEEEYGKKTVAVILLGI